MVKVYIVHGLSSDASFIHDKKVVRSIKDADIILFPDGKLLHDFIKLTFPIESVESVKKDIAEREFFKKIPKNKLCIGVGRGANTLAVCNGFSIFNHTNRREFSTHSIITSNNIKFEIPMQFYQCMFFDKHKIPYVDIYSKSGESIVCCLFRKPNLPKCLYIQCDMNNCANEHFINYINNIILQHVHR